MAAAQKIGRATVAPGRTVVAPHATAKQVIVGTDGKQTEIPADAHHGPGAEVELPAEEIASLRKLGFLVDPKTPEIPAAEGPTFSTQAKRSDAGE